MNVEIIRRTYNITAASKQVADAEFNDFRTLLEVFCTVTDVSVVTDLKCF